jgi:hypothetical protein
MLVVPQILRHPPPPPEGGGNNAQALAIKKRKMDSWNSAQTRNFKNTGDIYNKPAYRNFQYQEHEGNNEISNHDEEEEMSNDNMSDIELQNYEDEENPDYEDEELQNYEDEENPDYEDEETPESPPILVSPPPQFKMPPTIIITPPQQNPDNIASRTRSRQRPELEIPPYTPYRSPRTQQQQRPRSSRSKSAVSDLPSINKDPKSILRSSSVPKSRRKRNVNFPDEEPKKKGFLNNLFKLFS